MVEGHGADVLAVHADALAVGEDAGHEARLVHAEEAHELDVVAAGGRPKANAGVENVVDGLDGARARGARAKGDEGVVHVGENEFDHAGTS